MRRHQTGQVSGRGEGGVDLPRVAVAAVVDPAEVQLEAVAAAAALERQVRQVVVVEVGGGGGGGGFRGVVVVVVVVVEEVAGREGVAGVEAAQVGAEEEGAGEGDAHHLVRVHGDGVGEVAAGELGRVGGGEGGGAAPGGVDVQPEAVLPADGGEGPDGVVGAEDGGAGRRVEVEGRLALRLRRGDEGGEGGGVHAAGVRVHGDGADGRGAEAEHLGGLFDAVVAVGRGEEDEFQIVCGVAVGFGGGVEGVAGDDYGRGVGHGAPLHGNAAGVGSGEAEETGEGTGRVFFDHGEGGRYFVRVDVGVQGRQDQLGGEAGGVRRGVQFAHEAAVPRVD